jgi:hypothetical protein
MLANDIGEVEAGSCVLVEWLSVEIRAPLADNALQTMGILARDREFCNADAEDDFHTANVPAESGLNVSRGDLPTPSVRAARPRRAAGRRTPGRSLEKKFEQLADEAHLDVAALLEKSRSWHHASTAAAH